MIQENKIAMNEPKSSLADILLVIAKRLKLILLFIIIGVLIAVFHVKKDFKPEYTSSAVLFIPSDNYSGSSLSQMARQFGFSTGSNNNFDISSSALYPEIASSRTFALRLLDRKFYTKEFAEELPLIAILTYGTGSPFIGLDTLKSKVAGRIPSMIEFNSDPPFLMLNVITEEPQFSNELANAVLEELDKLQRDFKSQKVVEKKGYIEQQINIAKSELERLEENLKYFRERNRRINDSPSLMLTQERLERDVQIQQGIFLTLKQQFELAKIEEIQKTSFVQILDYPSLPFAISNPTKLSTYILGGIAGLFFALFIIFIMEYFSTGNPDEAKKLKTAKDFLIQDFNRLFRKKK